MFLFEGLIKKGEFLGLQAPYTDPATGLRYHDKSVYDVIKSLVRPTHQISI